MHPIPKQCGLDSNWFWKQLLLKSVEPEKSETKHWQFLLNLPQMTLIQPWVTFQRCGLLAALKQQIEGNHYSTMSNSNKRTRFRRCVLHTSEALECTLTISSMLFHNHLSSSHPCKVWFTTTKKQLRRCVDRGIRQTIASRTVDQMPRLFAFFHDYRNLILLLSHCSYHLFVVVILTISSTVYNHTLSWCSNAAQSNFIFLTSIQRLHANHLCPLSEHQQRLQLSIIFSCDTTPALSISAFTDLNLTDSCTIVLITMTSFTIGGEPDNDDAYDQDSLFCTILNIQDVHTATHSWKESWAAAFPFLASTHET